MNDEVAKLKYIIQEFMDTVTTDFHRMIQYQTVMSR